MYRRNGTEQCVEKIEFKLHEINPNNAYIVRFVEEEKYIYMGCPGHNFHSVREHK